MKTRGYKESVCVSRQSILEKFVEEDNVRQEIKFWVRECEGKRMIMCADLTLIETYEEWLLFYKKLCKNPDISVDQPAVLLKVFLGICEYKESNNDVLMAKIFRKLARFFEWGDIFGFYLEISKKPMSKSIEIIITGIAEHFPSDDLITKFVKFEDKYFLEAMISLLKNGIEPTNIDQIVQRSLTIRKHKVFFVLSGLSLTLQEYNNKGCLVFCLQVLQESSDRLLINHCIFFIQMIFNGVELPSEIVVALFRILSEGLFDCKSFASSALVASFPYFSNHYLKELIDNGISDVFFELLEVSSETINPKLAISVLQGIIFLFKFDKKAISNSIPDDIGTIIHNFLFYYESEEVIGLAHDLVSLFS